MHYRIGSESVKMPPKPKPPKTDKPNKTRPPYKPLTPPPKATENKKDDTAPKATENNLKDKQSGGEPILDLPECPKWLEEHLAKIEKAMHIRLEEHKEQLRIEMEEKINSEVERRLEEYKDERERG